MVLDEVHTIPAKMFRKVLTQVLKHSFSTFFLFLSNFNLREIIPILSLFLLTKSFLTQFCDFRFLKGELYGIYCTNPRILGRKIHSFICLNFWKKWIES